MPFINRCGGGGSAKLQSKTATPSTSEEVVVTPDSGFDGLDKCTVSAIKLQSKSVSPSTTDKDVYPDSSFDGLSTVKVYGIELTSKTVTPSKEEQTVFPGAGYDGLGSVTVNAAPTETKKITDNGTYTPTGDNVGFGSVEVKIPRGIFGACNNADSGTLLVNLTSTTPSANFTLPDGLPAYILVSIEPIRDTAPLTDDYSIICGCFLKWAPYDDSRYSYIGNVYTKNGYASTTSGVLVNRQGERSLGIALTGSYGENNTLWEFDKNSDVSGTFNKVFFSGYSDTPCKYIVAAFWD